MEWVPAPTPINENRRAQAVEKTGIIGTDQIYLFDSLNMHYKVSIGKNIQNREIHL